MRLHQGLLATLFIIGHGSLTGVTAATWEAVSTVMQDRCVSCHGPAKVKGGLRVDTLEMLRVGGKSGPVVFPGEPDRSSLYTLCALDDDDPDRMPGRGDPLTKEQLHIIHAWIAALPSWEEQVQAGADGDAFVYQDPWQTLSSQVGPVDKELIVQGEALGLVIEEPLPGLLQVDAGPRGQAWSTADTAWLHAVAPHVISLDLYRSQLASLPDLSPLVHLRHLQARDNQLSELPMDLTSVEVLNVAFNPKLNSSSLRVLTTWSQLRRLYFAGTQASQADQLSLPEHLELVH